MSEDTAEHLRAGYAAHRAGDLARAQQCYAQVLSNDPDHVDALHLCGLLLFQQGRHEQAVTLLTRALELQPAFAGALLNLGNALKALGRLDDAIDRYRGVLRIDPANAAAYLNLGNALLAAGRAADASGAFEQAIALQPRDPAAHNQLGHALSAMHRHEEAVAALERALALRPAYPGALTNLGVALHALGRSGEAVERFRQALRLAPDFPHALLNLGVTLDALNRCAEAVAPLTRLTQAAPALAAAQHHLGCALAGAGQGAAGRAHLLRAVAIDPELAPAWLELGGVAYDAGDFPAARRAFEQALRARPDLAAARYNLALLDLLDGDYAAGWPAYESRWQVWRDRPPATGAPWRGGAEAAGRVVVLYAEQGFGDTLQFVRYVPRVAALGARVILAVQTPLLTLLRPMARAWGVTLADAADALPDCDFHCPLASLPLASGTRLDTIPADPPYLRAPAAGIDALPAQTRLGPVAARPAVRARLGIVWAGAVRPRRENRAVALEQLAPLFALPGIEWTALRLAMSDADAALLPRWPSVGLADGLRDFADTAALFEQLDGVVCVDTAVAHLAGALGKPLWLMLPFAPDWRWLKQGARSPWYPHATLFRQASPDAWPGVVSAVASALSARFGL